MFSLSGRNTPTNSTPMHQTTTSRKLYDMKNIATIGEGVIVKEQSDLLMKCPVRAAEDVFVIWRKKGKGKSCDFVLKYM